jgi:eukaryotic-like serine/threonine-protein kinase
MCAKKPDKSEIFNAATERKDPAERAAYLDSVCGADRQLRAEIEELLKHDEQAGSFLNVPPPEPVATVDSCHIAKGAGMQVGPYKLLQQIGEGGMGFVYMAEQQEPVRRKVALKIIKPGMDSAQVIARFEAERQALAMMDHQNIARVFDAGTTDTGRPYFVMELVHGVPITTFCDERRLMLRQRLDLFIPVCQAIQHAHQKGIIHRDIKPSNVLVTMYDDRPVPKVIDFGIAKATDQRLTERTMFTHFGAMVGTFEYMSPEQAEMNAFGVDTRSDVYSLGVLVYELLTGTTPLEKSRFRDAAFNELVRLIKEEEPPCPSVRLSKPGTSVGIAAARNAEPAQLPRLVRGDLDWIVMRCLEKQRDRRYETANGLARDIQRYLADEPVEARPPSAGYRMQKFVRRNKSRVVAAGLVLLALVAGIVGTSIGLVAAQRARYAAEEQTKIADGARATAEAEKNQKDQERRRAEDERRRADAKAAEALAEKKLANQSAAEALAEKKRADQSAAEAAIEKQHAEKELLHSEWLLYANQIASAQRAWDTNDEVGAWRSLRACRKDFRGWEYNYLDALFAPNLRRTIEVNPPPVTSSNVTLDTFLTSPANVTCAAFSPDGQRIVSGSRGGELSVWEVASGRILLTLKGHRFAVTCVAFSPGGQRLASNDGVAVKVWDVVKDPTGLVGKFAPRDRLLLTYEKSAKGASDLAFSPDGKRIAGVSSDNTFTVWDATTGRAIAMRKGPAARLGDCIALSADWKWVANGSIGNTFTVWDATTGGTIRTFKGHKAQIDSLAFSPDGKLIASSDETAVKIWDLATGNEVCALRGRADGIHPLVFSPDGKQVAGAGSDNGLAIWDAMTGEQTLRLTGHAGRVESVAFSPGGKQVVSAGNDGTLRVWEATSNRETPARQAHVEAARCVACSRDGKKIVVAGSDRTLKLRDTTSGRDLLTLKGAKEPGMGAAFSPDGKKIVAVDNDFSLNKLSLDHHYAALPDEKGVVLINIDATPAIWDAETGEKTVALAGTTKDVTCAAFSPDGRQIVCGTWEGAIKLWNAATGTETQMFRRRGDPVISVAFSPDGKRIAAGCIGLVSRRGVLTVWDATTGRQTCSILDSHATLVVSVAFSPDGKQIVAGAGGILGQDTLIVWDAASGRELFPLRGHVRDVRSVVYSPDGQRIVSGSWDGNVKVWEAGTGLEMITLRHGGKVNGVVFSPDGKRIISSNQEGTVKIWDASRGPKTPQ